MDGHLHPESESDVENVAQKNDSLTLKPMQLAESHSEYFISSSKNIFH